MCSHSSVLISLCHVFICLHQSLLGQVRMYTLNILKNIVSLLGIDMVLLLK